MKKGFSILVCMALSLLASFCVFAQGGSKPGVLKQINSSAAQADKWYGKKIQQESLSINHFYKPLAARQTKKNQSRNTGAGIPEK